MKHIEGGVTAAKGFTAGGVAAGIRKKNKLDVALVASEKLCAAAGVYTQNLVQGAPIVVCKKHLENDAARAIIINSGKANTCNADGEEVALKMCEIAAKTLGISADDVLVASTGVIGQPLPVGLIAESVPKIELSKEGHTDAATAILTTDTILKETAVEVQIGGKTCAIGGMAKGVGMIHPNMATLLCFITTDVKISAKMLKKALKEVADDTFNMISVDGDTSTNDTVLLLANGLAENAEINADGEDFKAFKAALFEVMVTLSKMLAGDGEGATKLITCTVDGAKTVADAKKAAKAVICSSLVKTAMFGADANWGRVLCAVGYSGAEVDVKKIGLKFSSKAGSIEVCKDGAGIEFSEEDAKKILSEKEITIGLTLQDGNAFAAAWGCDLSYDYVKINGDYRS